jgi:hypothetical protein
MITTAHKLIVKAFCKPISLQADQRTYEQITT